MGDRFEQKRELPTILLLVHTQILSSRAALSKSMLWPQPNGQAYICPSVSRCGKWPPFYVDRLDALAPSPYLAGSGTARRASEAMSPFGVWASAVLGARQTDRAAAAVRADGDMQVTTAPCSDGEPGGRAEYNTARQLCFRLSNP